MGIGKRVGFWCILFLISTQFLLKSFGDVPHFRVEHEEGKSFLYIDTREGSKRLCELVKIPAGTKYYHWGKSAEVERITHQGYVDQSELDVLAQGHGMAQGGGFYVSLDPFDSKAYGPRLLVLEAQRDLIVAPDTCYNVRNAPRFVGGRQADHFLNERNQGLRAVGIQGTIEVKEFFGQNWLNFFDSAATSRVREAIGTDFLSEDYGLKDITFNTFLEIDRLYGLSDAPVIKKDLPAFSNLFRGKLSPVERNELAQDLSAIVNYFDNSISQGKYKEGPSLFIRKLSKEFKNELIELFKEKINRYLIRGTQDTVDRESTRDFETTLKTALLLGIRTKDLFPSETASLSQPRLIYGRVPKREKERLNPFGKQLLETMEFIDYFDLLVEMLQDRELPWQRYDEPGVRPFIERWREATSPKLKEIHKTLAEKDGGEFRDHVVVAGGDIHYPNLEGYIRLSERKARVLSQNRFLTVQIAKDPESKTSNKTALVKYEYPSARNFEQYGNLLSPDLQNKLYQAKMRGTAGLVADQNSTEFKNLTKEIIAHLVNEVENQRSSPLYRYQLLMAIHPFADYNGRSLRKWYSNNNKNLSGTKSTPLFLDHFDNDLYLTYVELAESAILGEFQRELITKGLLEEQSKDPVFPKFYNAPELWKVGTELYHVDDLDKFNWLTKEQVYLLKDLIREKRISEVKETLAQFASDFLLTQSVIKKLPKTMRKIQQDSTQIIEDRCRAGSLR